jgi:GT2 family glycosyltransferase
MQSNSIERRLKKIDDIWLTISVHFHAFRANPKAYLTALWWWIRRKRVRARGQLAPLLSRSPKAYILWALRQDRKAESYIPHNICPLIVALVDMGAGETAQGDLEATLRSLSAEGLHVILIGSPETPNLADAAARIDWDENPWVMPVIAGDKIAAGTAVAYCDVIGDPSLRIIYADDDKLCKGGHRTAPHFKPDWNSELFRYFDYLTGACILRVSRQELAKLASVSDWAQQLVARAAGEGTPLHLHKMLHHRRTRPVPRVPAAPTILSHDLPPITVIVPTRNRVELLRTCMEGIAATHYRDVEVIVVDNDSDDPQTLDYLNKLDPAYARVMRHTGDFNYSAINNHAVGEARGQLLCLLNNDIEVIEPNWLAIMAIQAQRENVGAVGAQLLYPDRRIQHAGVVIGVGNAAGHAHRFVRPHEEGYFRRHALPQFITAVTAACLVVKRERFLAVGGLDEQNFAVAFNDVDLCLRLNQRGWQSFYEPRATLIHHESVSRGLDQDPVDAARFAGELAALQRLWGTDKIVDKFHHPQLSRASERFAMAM